MTLAYAGYSQHIFAEAVDAAIASGASFACPSACFDTPASRLDECTRIHHTPSAET